MKRFAMTFACFLALTGLIYSQDSTQSRFPIAIEYEGLEGVLISYDQLDSAIITHSYLTECKEYNDSLESTVGALGSIIEQGKSIEAELEDRIALRDSMSTVKDEYIKYQEKNEKKLQRKLKFFKMTTMLFGSATAVLVSLRLLGA